MNMNSNYRFPISVLIFTLIYAAAIGLAAMRSGNPELVSYLLVMAVLITAIAIVDRRCHIGRTLLWCFSAWGLVHMTGGLVRIPGFWPYNEPNEVMYSLWLIPDRLKYDQVVHVYGFGITTWLCWEMLGKGLEMLYGKRPEPTFGLISLCVAGGMGFGALNEMVEFIATLTLTATNVGGYENTGWDLVSNLIGSVSAGALIYLLGREYAKPARGSGGGCN